MHCKIKPTRKLVVINEVVCKWYGKCCAAGIYPFGSMLLEALKVKESLNDSFCTVLLRPVSGWKNGNSAMEFETPVLSGKQMMSLFLL